MRSTIGALLFACVTALLVTPSFARSDIRINCINQQRQIDGAKELAALELKLPRGAVVDTNIVAKYIHGGLPQCQAGGVYTIGPIGVEPSCSIPDHTLAIGPQLEFRREMKRTIKICAWVLIGGLVVLFLYRHRRRF